MEAISPYDEAFYEEETKVALESAAIVLPYVFEQVKPSLVVDIGAGTGGWASVAADLGAIIKAVDFDIDDHMALVPITNQELSQGYDCTGWDLAICLEVAEHLPEASGPLLVDGLSKAKAVLFSAATPGQPGVNHINCKPHDYWHLLFERHGLYPTHIGPLFGPPVADFYCRNLFLYRRP